ncbi:Putative ribonuclease H protein At1g65750, partial [Linum perenne]
DCLLEEMVARVVGMLPPKDSRVEDQWVWGPNRDGVFRIKSAYELLKEDVNDQPDDIWKIIWQWKGSNKVQCFLWLVGLDHLLTNLQGMKRKLTNDASCSSCHYDVEDALHVIRDCHFENKFEAAGGLVRNEVGYCVAAFMVNLGNCSITRAKMRGSIMGLQMAWDKGCRKVELQVHSKASLQPLDGGGRANSPSCYGGF